jgi:predicted nucleotidyltransferase component of viral defense system
MNNLDHFKSEVARLFFSLQSSEGYLLAGGGALLASGLSVRKTEDLDFFGHRSTREMAIVSRVFELAAIWKGWTIRPLRRLPEFVRLQVEGDETIAIDFCRDSPATLPIKMTPVGPAFAGEELGGRKLLALFARAEARDFVDVYFLSMRFGRNTIYTFARQLDLGFGPQPLTEAFARLTLYSDSDLPIDQALVPDLREFFRVWTAELSA